MLRGNAGCVDNGHHGTPGNVPLAVKGLVEMLSQRLVHSLSVGFGGDRYACMRVLRLPVCPT